MNLSKPLSALPVGKRGQVLSLSMPGRMRRRLMDLGLVPGAEVTCLGRSPMGDPTAYLIRGAVIAIRASDAGGVLVHIK